LLWGLGWPEWLTIILLVGALWLTFWLMARASMAYEARRRRDQQGPALDLDEDGERLGKERS
jgi:hypothetical protein